MQTLQRQLKKIIFPLLCLLTACSSTPAPNSAAKMTQADINNTQMSHKKMIIPKITPQKPFQTQLPQKFTLDNGIELWIIQNKLLPLTTMRITNKAGSFLDPQDKAGLAAFTTAMLKEGTSRQTSFEISESIELTGASLNTYANTDSAGIILQVLSQNFKQILTTAIDIYTQPTFPETEFQKLKTIILNNLAQRDNKPENIAKIVSNKIFFGDNHPYALPTEGLIHTFNKIQRDDLTNFYKFYAPQHTQIVISSDLEPNEIYTLLNQQLASWKPSAKQITPPQINSKQSNNIKLYIVDKPNAPQSVIRITLPAPKNTDPNILKLQWMNIPFGASFTSRLMQNIREDKGYTYGAYANFVPLDYDGYFISTASVSTDVTGPALAEFLYEFRRLQNKDFTEEELNRSKSTWQADYVQSAENQMAVVSMFTNLIAINLPVDTLNKFSLELENLTLDDLNNLASSLPNIDKHGLILIVGDKNQIIPQLKSLGLPQPIIASMPSNTKQ